MTHTLLIAGLNGSGPGHWQQWWISRDPLARLVVQRDWNRPDLSSWSEILLGAIASSPGSILVAHSLGCSLVAHLAARWPGLPVRAALLVAPADIEDSSWAPAAIRSFGAMPLSKLPYPSAVVASRNDPCARIDRARHFARSWNSRLIDLGECGHINIASGFGPWPGGMALRDALGGEIEAPSSEGPVAAAPAWGAAATGLPARP